MSKQKAVEWLAEHWTAALAGCIGTMLPEGSEVTCQVAAGAVPRTDRWSWWTQPFVAFSGPAVTVGATPESWNRLSAAVLAAVGVDDASEEDVAGTTRDLIAQSGTGLAREVAGRCGTDPNSGDVSEGAPPGSPLHAILRVTLTGMAREVELGIFLHGELLDAVAAADQPAGESAQIEMPAALGCIRLQSHVTLGRTTMLLKDIFKMTAGSVIELRQMVTDAADLVANGKTVARGQIVILHGDYALKVTSIAHREAKC
jgi:flagellar motor switch protein FliN/FliY